MMNPNQPDSPVQCILFCEFHPNVGPVITFQVPENYMVKEIFDSLSAYIIPKPELQGRLITVNARGHKVIGYPVGIDNDKYKRNRYLFNLCFVCDAAKRTVQYEPLVKKLADYFEMLEKESFFLTSDDTKHTIPELLAQVQVQLNCNRSALVSVTPSTTIHLKIARVHPEPRQVLDHDVPIFLTSEESIIPSQWDLTTQQVLPYIDGYRHVARIAQEADVEVSLVKACIQNMIYYGIVTLIPIFQYSNVYVTTPSLVELYTDGHLAEECLKQVSKQEQAVPLFKSVFQMYAAMKPGVTVKDICTRYNPSTSGIDEKKLIRFGVLKGIIRRIHKYPVLTTDPSAISAQRGVYRLFDGSHSLDEICVLTSKSPLEIEEKVEKHPQVVTIWK
ncbi:GATOR complex protein NPRL2 [Halotydeus destructor]|nr:GATOR complex protein NPRL2 [Halotydeus destructor]